MSNSIKKTVLAIDTALGGVSVGIMARNGHIVSRMIETAREQATILVPTIQEVLSEAECEFSDIDLIVCSKGPGSFTGIRIGLATARTMALALDKPIIGVNTLDVMARHYQTEKPLLVVLETKRQDFYASYYDANRKALTEQFAIDAPEVLGRAPMTGFDVGGDCLERFQACVSVDVNCLDNLTQPDPILMAQYGLEIFEEHGDQGSPQPLYLRGADISYPKNPPRKLAEA
jgi:tRNA threonylcarbamoyladenosine biosynthesis protein TsaB